VQLRLCRCLSAPSSLMNDESVPMTMMRMRMSIAEHPAGAMCHTSGVLCSVLTPSPPPPQAVFMIG
jgi:hypothetical protein